MAQRPTTRELAEARKRERLDQMKADIREGTLTVRQMTPQERKKAEADRATAVRKRASRASSRPS